MNRLLFRVYKTKGKASIYCANSSLDPNYLIFPVLVLNHQKKIRLHSFFKSFKPAKRKGVLIKFINKRYGYHNDVDHFASVDDMLDFILDEESRRIDESK